MRYEGRQETFHAVVSGVNREPTDVVRDAYSQQDRRTLTLGIRAIPGRLAHPAVPPVVTLELFAVFGGVIARLHAER